MGIKWDSPARKNTKYARMHPIELFNKSKDPIPNILEKTSRAPSQGF